MTPAQTRHIKPCKKRHVRSQFLSVLAYLGTLCFIPLSISDDDQYILLHARQGLVLWGLELFATPLLFIPGVGKSLFLMVFVPVVALSLLGILGVLLRRTWCLPIVYRLSRAI
ncbi:Magnetosome protein MamF [Candidatus Terasakiella magnetica]|uniref:Magnetosome protein MamF n=1 Tax=Candidatus Terasakiella magnetica TaxID=1867952 RepID=A0A1C3RKE7_9PROT|nr:hypothetical protein [Candidatus Terasakiella magnetica]SCA57715.1 Magnetosome protein MamF [Candidatus Terasakiella magnetica]